MRALVVGAAPEPGGETFYRELVGSAGFVIAADAAAEWCVGLGRVPDVAVGDFDSAAEGAPARLRALGCRVVELPAAKDVSDLDACVEEARRAGATRATLTAAFSGRLDHTLCGLGALLDAADLDAEVREPCWHAAVVGGAGASTRAIDAAPGETFSVIAPAGARGVRIAGGHYPLEGRDLEGLSSQGLSNVATGPVTVSVGSGVCLVIVLREG